VVVILCATLIAMQAAVDVALSVMRDTDWAPSFADVRRAASASTAPGSRA
jgi:hypothetical protein